jgi:hypothetical protein
MFGGDDVTDDVERLAKHWPHGAAGAEEEGARCVPIFEPRAHIHRTKNTEHRNVHTHTTNTEAFV